MTKGAHCLSKIVFLKRFLIQNYRGLSVQKRCFSYFFGLYSKTALRIFPIFCMSVEDNRAHCLSKIVFLNKFIILDYRGLIVQKRCFFYFFALYSKTALSIFSIFCMIVEDDRAHCLSKIVCLKKILILDYRGLSFQKRFFLLLCTLLLNGSMDLPNFLHECRGK